MGTNLIYDVHYANSIFVAVGAGGGTTNTGGITYSTDGLTWTRKSQSLTVGSSYFSVTYNGTNWIVGASASTNNILTASTPSGTWTASLWGSAVSIPYVTFDGTRTIGTYEGDGTYYYSTAAVPSTRTNYNNITNPNPYSGSQLNYYYDGRIYAMGVLINNFSTTPSANSTSISSNVGQAVITPFTLANSASGLQTTGNAVWVGAAGYIIGNSYGDIYTSF